MALNASKVKGQVSKGPKAEPLEAGNYLARVVQILDLGIQEQRPFKGTEKPPAHEIMLTYELGTEFMKDDDGNDDPTRPRWVGESFPLHNFKADLAKSTKRAKALDPSSKLGGNFAEMAGFPCTVTIVQRPDAKSPDIIYNNVANVTPAMKGVPVPELVNPPKVFDLDEPDLEVFGSLPEWIQEKIKSNLGYNGSLLQKMLEGAVKEAPKEVPQEEPAPQGEEEEGNPY